MAKKSVEAALKTPVLSSEIKVNTPENWCWARLIQLFNFIDYRGKTPTKIETGVPFITAKNIRMGYLDYAVADFISREEYEQRQTRGISRRGDILFTTEAPMGNVAIADLDEYSAGQRVITFQKRSHAEWISNKFYFYYILSCYFQDELQRNKTGNTVEGIKAEKLMRFPVPVPPCAEQQRIVDHIEYLFAKLDEAKEKAQSALDSFETRKAAILHKAFTGELTAKWRAENEISYDTWRVKKLDDVCDSIFDGDHMPPPKSESGIPFLVISNVNTGFLSFDNTRFVPHEYYDSLTETRKPEKGDVLYTLVGSYGIPVVVDSDNPFCFQRHMALLKPNMINTRCLWYLLQTQEMYQKASNIAKGVAQLTVPIKGLRAMDFMCPSNEEQLEIVHILDSLFAKEQQAKEAAEAVLEKIDMLKKSILARAFRGELGTNDPTEQSALELLKSIL